MIKGTTILMVRHQGKIVLAGDGQVTMENIVLKHAARKVRRLYQDKVMSGFAGATADAFTLYERQLQALMIVADETESYLISGTGDVIEPEDGVLAIGSGGPFASAAARALIRHTRLSAREVAEEAMKIAADMCIYTNENFVFDEMDSKT